MFAIGSLFGVRRSPYGWVYRELVRPRLGPPAELEDPAPPRFAQTVGLAFLAAFLNAAANLCLGCRAYVVLLRIRHRPGTGGPASGSGAPPVSGQHTSV